MDLSPISPDTLVSCSSTQSENPSPNVSDEKEVETPSKRQRRNSTNNFSKSVYSIINL